MFLLVIDMEDFIDNNINYVAHLPYRYPKNTPLCIGLLRGLRRFDIYLSGFWPGPPSSLLVVECLGNRETIRYFAPDVLSDLPPDEAWAERVLSRLKATIIRHTQSIHLAGPDPLTRTGEDNRQLRHLLRLTGVFPLGDLRRRYGMLANDPGHD